MKRYVNLMSAAAQLAELRRTRCRQWSCVLLVLAALLVPPAIAAWWPAYRQAQQLAALEMQYEPTRQLIAETKKLRKKIDLVRQQGRLALALSRQTPVVTLLGMIGAAVDQLDGQVYVQSIDLRQNPDPWRDANDRSAVTLNGLGYDSLATAHLTESLKTNLPFASVELTDSNTTAVQGEPRHSFTIQGAFP